MRKRLGSTLVGVTIVACVIGLVPARAATTYVCSLTGKTTSLTTVDAGTDFGFSVKVRVPETARPGPAQIAAVGATGTTTHPFTVRSSTPPVTLPATGLPLGALVLVAGAFLALGVSTYVAATRWSGRVFT